MTDQESLKVELLKVQVSSAGDSRGPVSLLQQCLNILQQTNSVQTRIGLLMLISNWTNHCIPAVSHVLSTNGVIPFLTGQIGSNEHDEMERLSQGLCAFLLGLLIIGNDNSVASYSQEELMQLIEKRIGCEIFLDKLSEVSKHEGYNRALKHPQIKVAKQVDLVFDNSFCHYFKQSEHLVINHLSANQRRLEGAGDQPDTAVLMQYKELIREQDTRISAISQANIYLQHSLATSKQQLEDMTTSVQTLQDQNSVLKAQSQGDSTVSPNNGPLNLKAHHGTEIALKEAQSTIMKLEKELKVRDDIIHELEVRITLSPPNNGSEDQPVINAIEVQNMQLQLYALQAALATRETEIETLKALKSGGDSTGPTTTSLMNNGSQDQPVNNALEVQQMQLQLYALQAALATRESEIETLKALKSTPPPPPTKTNGDLNHVEDTPSEHEPGNLQESYTALQSEQEDLLMMLSDQDSKLRDYKKKLKALGQAVEEDLADDDDYLSD
jgi:hypothetical protein